MRAKARRWRLSEAIDLVVVDYLQLMPARQRFEFATRKSHNLAQSGLAKELNVRWWLFHSCRALRKPHRPSSAVADWRESGAEQDADLVAFIYREEAYKRTDENRNIAELIVAKQRNGPTDTLYLAFLNQFARFTDLDKDALGSYLSRFDRSRSPRIERGGDEF